MTTSQTELRRFSLERQVVSATARWLLLALVLLWAGSSFILYQQMKGYLLEDIQEDIEEIAEHLIRQGPHRISVSFRELEHAFLEVRSGHYFVVRVPPHGPVIRSPSLENHSLPLRQTDSPYEVVGPAGHRLLVMHRQVQLAQWPVDIWVAEDFSTILERVWRFDLFFGVIGVLIMLGMFWMQRRQLRRTFSLFDVLAQSVKRMQSEQQRFEPPATVPVEVQPLTEALSTTLTQLHQRLAQLRRANADLSHALKTPLNLAMQYLDEPDMRACPRTSEIQQQLRRLQAYIQRELQRARIAGPSWHGNPFSLETDLPDLLDTLAQLYRDCQIDSDVKVEGEILPLEREDAYELLGNLLDNACKWAQKNVRLRLRQQSDHLEITVEDDGPGVSAEQLTQLGIRGHRLDERVPGSGLGLSIAQDIVQRYGGMVSFSTSTQGGLKVSLKIPRSGSLMMAPAHGSD